jgi:hypothetical protein
LRPAAISSRGYFIVALLLALSSCVVMPLNNAQVSQQMRSSLDNNKLREAYNAYSKLSAEEKQKNATVKMYQQLTKNISLTRVRVKKLANEAIQKDNWSQASKLYNAHIPIIAIDDAFQKDYQQFVSKMAIKKRPFKNELLISKAEYLILRREMERAIFQLDPFDAGIELQLDQTKKEVKATSKLLLSQGLDAYHNSDITMARKLIPLAKALYNDKTARIATDELEESVRPIEVYITKLTEYGTQLYSNERYKNSLEIWDAILYLDPNNKKVVANKERTLKVLLSLEKIKQESNNITSPQADQ